MTPKLRREEIVVLVNFQKDLTVEELAAKLDVSRETIRRDLTVLDDAGLIRKYHGGARALPSGDGSAGTESPYAQRLAQNPAAKRAIALAAAKIFKPGDTVFIDTGSTTVILAEALSQVANLTVITNSPRVAALVAANRSNKVFLLGGAYHPEVGESLGPLAIGQLGHFRAEHVILTVGAIDGAAIMDYDLQEAEMARAMIERAGSVTVIADHSKLGKKAVFEVAPLARISRLVTDRQPDAELADAFAAAGIDVVIADPA